MALSEAEELELLNLEHEKFSGGNPSPLQSKNPIGAMQQAARETPEWERRAAAAGASLMAPIEGIKQAALHGGQRIAEGGVDLITGLGLKSPEEGAKVKERVGGIVRSNDERLKDDARAMEALYKESPAARGVGIATDVATGALMPGARAAGGAKALEKIAAGGATGGMAALLNPAVGEGDFASQKGKQAATGAAVGGVLTGGIEGLLRAPGAIGRLLTVGGKKESPKAPTSEGAGKAVGELQTQRDVMTDRVPAREGQAASEFERASKDFDERMVPLREEAFRGSPINVESATNLIAQLEAKNPDAKVRAALREAKDTIVRAVESEGGSMTPSTPLRTYDKATGTFKNVETGGGAQMSVPMADEVRQSINRQINQKGDSALDGHTKDVLAQVRDNIVGKTSKEYQNYLQQFSKGKAELDKYSPENTVLGEVTTDKRGSSRLAGTDAQNALEAVFSGKMPERDIRQLVESIKQNPEALDGAKEAFRKWLMPTSPTGKVNVKESADRWMQSKEAVQKSGLFEPGHYAAIDKVATDLAQRAEATSGLKGAAGAIGSILSYKTAVGFRTAAGWISRSTDKTPQQVEALIQKVMSDEQIAKLAAAPATSESIMALEKALSSGGGYMAGEQKPRRKPSPLSMQPAGL